MGRRSRQTDGWIGREREGEGGRDREREGEKDGGREGDGWREGKEGREVIYQKQLLHNLFVILSPHFFPFKVF